MTEAKATWATLATAIMIAAINTAAASACPAGMGQVDDPIKSNQEPTQKGDANKGLQPQNRTPANGG